MNAEEVIDNAIAYIETNGWCQNELFTDAGQACLRGALNFGAGSRLRQHTWGDGITSTLMDDDQFDEAAFRAADDIVTKEIVQDGNKVVGVFDIPSFNDLVTTTQEDVVLVLKRAKESASADLRN